MSVMTRRERLMTLFAGGIPDRPAVKVWGAGPGAPLANPGFERVRQLALAKTDLMVSTGSPFSVYAGRFADERITWVEKPTADPEWVVVDKTYEPYPFDPGSYHRTDEAVGDAGIAMVGLDHAAMPPCAAAMSGAKLPWRKS